MIKIYDILNKYNTNENKKILEFREIIISSYDTY